MNERFQWTYPNIQSRITWYSRKLNRNGMNIEIPKACRNKYLYLLPPTRLFPALPPPPDQLSLPLKPIPITPLFCLPPQATDLLHCASLEQVISIQPPPWRASSTATCPRISASVGRGPPVFKRNEKKKQNPRNNFLGVFKTKKKKSPPLPCF